jgi:hypothetical protein
MGEGTLISGVSGPRHSTIRSVAEHDARKIGVLYSEFAKGVAETEAPIIDYRPKG